MGAALQLARHASDDTAPPSSIPRMFSLESVMATQPYVALAPAPATALARVDAEARTVAMTVSLPEGAAKIVDESRTASHVPVCVPRPAEEPIAVTVRSGRRIFARVAVLAVAMTVLVASRTLFTSHAAAVPTQVRTAAPRPSAEESIPPVPDLVAASPSTPPLAPARLATQPAAVVARPHRRAATPSADAGGLRATAPASQPSGGGVQAPADDLPASRDVDERADTDADTHLSFEDP